MTTTDRAARHQPIAGVVTSSAAPRGEPLPELPVTTSPNHVTVNPARIPAA
jgi:hypothetical protein